MGRSSRQISLPFIKIDRKARRPVYEQLYEGIRSAILNGILRPDDRLPATRLIAEEMGVSRNIVVMAFEQLVMEGYVQSRSGSGSFVAAETPAGMEKAGRGKNGPAGKGMDRKERVRKGAGMDGRVSSGTGKGTRRLSGHFVRTLEQVVSPRNTVREESLLFQTGQPAFDVFPFAVWSKLAARMPGWPS